MSMNNKRQPNYVYINDPVPTPHNDHLYQP